MRSCIFYLNYVCLRRGNVLTICSETATSMSIKDLKRLNMMSKLADNLS